MRLDLSTVLEHVENLDHLIDAFHDGFVDTIRRWQERGVKHEVIDDLGDVLVPIRDFLKRIACSEIGEHNPILVAWDDLDDGLDEYSIGLSNKLGVSVELSKRFMIRCLIDQLDVIDISRNDQDVCEM